MFFPFQFWHLFGTFSYQVPPICKSTQKVVLFIKKSHNFTLFSNDILAVEGTTHIRKTHKNNVDTEAEAKAEAWAGKVHGGNRDSPLADNCYEVSTA